MTYKVKLPILGFEDMVEVKLDKIDDTFVILRDMNNAYISLTLVNPYALREYSFDLPSSVKALLNINENSKCSIYNVVVVQSPLDESMVNFLAPIIFNEDNQTVAQVVLNETSHPNFGMCEKIKSFIK